MINDFPANLNDAELRSLRYLADQAKEYNGGSLPPHAQALSNAVEAEQKRRTVALRNPVTGSRRVELKAGPR